MKYTKALLIVLAAAFALTITSCEELLAGLFGVSIEERIVAFEKTLNTPERTDILDHLHPDMNNWAQLKDATVFVTGPLSYDNADFTIVVSDIDDEKVATCSYSNINADGVIVFTMELDGYDYKIRKLKLTLDDNPDLSYDLKRLLSR